MSSLLSTSWIKTRPAQKLLVRVKFTSNTYSCVCERSFIAVFWSFLQVILPRDSPVRKYYVFKKNFKVFLVLST